MYTVKQVAALTGVREATLRVWERRYGVVEPGRSGSGYRLYSDDELKALRSMSALVKTGVPAAKAASVVRELEVVEESPGGAEAGALVAAAMELSTPALDRLLSDAFAARPLESAIDDWLYPELERLGEAWRSGRLTIAHEHFASAGVMRRLASEFAVDSGRPREGTVLVGLPEGGRHELMLLAFAACLRRRGADVIYLGADVPVAEWERTALATLPRGVVLGAYLDDDVRPAQATVDRLASVPIPPAVFVGGRRGADIVGSVALPVRVGDAAAHVFTALRAGAA